MISMMGVNPWLLFKKFSNTNTVPTAAVTLVKACCLCPLNSNVKITAAVFFGLQSGQAEVFKESYHIKSTNSQAVMY